MIGHAGIYQIDATDYHADPCPEPSLSSGIARGILSASPLHAWQRHPRLNPAFEPEESDRFDVGTAAHALMLEGSERFAVIDAPDYRSKQAQQERALARAEGKTPILAQKLVEIRAMVDALRQRLESFRDEPRPLSDGVPERSLIWQEPSGIWCRARPDWIHEDGETIDDLKTTENANPNTWTRTLFNAGHDIQAAFYLRGYLAITGIRAFFRFVVVEVSAPYGCAVISLSPAALAVAERKVSVAIALWSECLRSGRWPGYPDRTCYAELPPWQEAQWMEREQRSAEWPQIIDSEGTYRRAG